MMYKIFKFIFKKSIEIEKHQFAADSLLEASMKDGNGIAIRKHKEEIKKLNSR